MRAPKRYVQSTDRVTVYRLQHTTYDRTVLQSNRASYYTTCNRVTRLHAVACIVFGCMRLPAWYLAVWRLAPCIHGGRCGVASMLSATCMLLVNVMCGCLFVQSATCMCLACSLMFGCMHVANRGHLQVACAWHAACTVRLHARC
jgi:hypothetical protein